MHCPYGHTLYPLATGAQRVAKPLQLVTRLARFVGAIVGLPPLPCADMPWTALLIELAISWLRCIYLGGTLSLLGCAGPASMLP